MNDVKIVELIRTTIRTKGKGVDDDPIRIITDYWTKEGVLVMSFDPCRNPEPEKIKF